ncbi:MAG TPA: hypothetical protein VNA65_09930, partial [Candidatus Dormibacteraeota bacterium]|nr:hypothetical protein [Candidatus Dormibacteraeota bacterium]
NLHPDLGTFAQWYGIPINVAPPPSTGVTPTFAYDSESDHPTEGYPVDQNTFIEGGPGAPSGSDRHAPVVDKNLCKLYEIYNLQNFTNSQTPQAGSGAVWNLSSNAMRPAGWTSSDAAGLPIAPLLLRPDEIQAGSITHAIRFTAHCTVNSYIWPASHQAGSCGAGYPPMGARFRLRSSFNVSGYSASTQVVLRAFQHYGLILADNGSDWYFGGTTDNWWGTATGSTVISELKTIPANQFEAVDESKLQVSAGSYQALATGAAALPQDRLHFGVGNSGDLNWMLGTGVPWRYRYAYLAGGVNTSKPWQNWNSPTGAYATNYMNDSGNNGFIPVFTYYEMLQSLPSTGANESDRDFSNLNNTGTMNAYYSNFKLLMQLAGAYGKPVVVHVEPDLWGYLEQRANGGDASTLTASVASSNLPEASGLPNTAQGFAWTLLKLRDMYGPNAILALHASLWGSGIDIGSDTNPGVNAAGEADKQAAFLNSAGITSNPYGSTWDLVFNDVDDHDAGWWEAQGQDNASFTHWWDPTNTTFPNFARYLSWVGELHAKTARSQVVWQVPVGNQYYLTMNNTNGHFQDNVGAYFISHATDLYNAGLIAVLFGSGNQYQTDYTDAMGDGITNGNGSPITDTLGYCNQCNTHTSTVADDDGGFLRTFVGQYYGVNATRPFKGLYTLDAYGGVHPDDSAVIGNAPNWPWPAARAAKAMPGASSPQTGLVLDAWGGLHPYGSPAIQIGQEPYYPNLDVARDFVFLSNGTGGYELDGWGGIHPFSIGNNPLPPQPWQYPYFPGNDVAKKITLLPDASGGYVLDAYGGLHPWSVTGKPLPAQIAEYGYWYGQNIARDMWLDPNASATSASGYVLDAFGGFHPFWTAGAAAPATVTTYGYWYGRDIARGMWLPSTATPSTATGYVLDGYGGIHPFSVSGQPLPPAIVSYGYWPGRDIAKSLFGS